MTKAEFERLRIFLKVHDPKKEDYHASFILQDGSFVSVKDTKSMRIEGEVFHYDKKKSLQRKDIKRTSCFWACPKARFAQASYF